MVKIWFICTSLLVLTGVVRSKPDYIYNSVVDGWLKLHSIPATWQEAFLRCHYEGAVLASPLDDRLTTSLHAIMSKSKIGNSRIFLGTQALNSKGDFFSIEGVPLADMDITWGGNGLGANGDGDCLTMSIEGYEKYMYVSPCTERHPYICYKKQETETSLEPCGTFDKKYVLKERTGSCYKLHQKHQSWWRAHMICAAEGGYLAILNDKEETSIVTEMFPDNGSGPPSIESERLHIGVRAWDNDSAWMTIHGDSLENVFNSWTALQPDDDMENKLCGALLGDGTLYGEGCDSEAMFICEKHPNTTRYADKTSDLKVVIKKMYMSKQMQEYAISYATKALEKFSNEKEMASDIKAEFDKKYNQYWQCIVGYDFHSYVSFELNHYIFFYLGNMTIQIFKSP